MLTVPRSLRSLAQAALARNRQRRRAAAIRRELRALDDRTLRDLGFARDEIASIAAEATGQAQCTRIRLLVTARFGRR